MNDTPKEVEDRYRKMLLSLPVLERLRMASRMHNSARRILIAGIKNELGDIGEARLRGELFRRMYGNDFTPEELEKIVSRMPNMEL